MSEEYDLAESEKAIGQLRAVVKDAEGRVVDGKHRLEKNPEWRTEVWQNLQTEEDYWTTRAHLNFTRRNAHEAKAEKKTIVDSLAAYYEGQGLNVAGRQRLADGKGAPVNEVLEAVIKALKGAISESWIRHNIDPKYLQEQRKREEAPAERLVAEKQELKRGERPQAVPCDVCGYGTYCPNEWHDHTLCIRCYKQAVLQPELILGKLNRAKPTQPSQPQEPQKPKETVKDKWEYRAARMTPQHSKMEEKVQQKLQALGVRPIVTGKKFCLLDTEPDYYIPPKNIAVYLDQEEVHKNRKDRDDELRDWLAKKYGFKVLPFPFKYATDREADPIARKIKEAFDQE